MTRYIISSNWASHLTWLLALLSSEECFATILTSGYQKKWPTTTFLLEINMIKREKVFFNDVLKTPFPLCGRLFLLRSGSQNGRKNISPKAKERGAQ